MQHAMTILCCALIACTVAAGATPVSLRGTVTAADTRLALEGATIYIVELQRGTTSDAQGAYVIDGIRPGSYTVMCTMLGYSTHRTAVTMTADVRREFVMTPEAITMSGVTVTEQGGKSGYAASNQSIVMLSPVELSRHRGQTLGQLLENVPGVTLLQTGPAIAKPVVRGIHSQRILVLNAGVPQEGQQWGGEHAPEIDPFAPAQIQVLKGVAGVEYGAGAIGGVISIEPRKLRESTGVAGELTLNGFSNNRQGSGSLILEGAHEFLPGVSWRVQGSMRRAGNSRTPSYWIGNSGFFERDASAAIGYSDERFGTELYVSRFSTELAIYKGSHLGNLDDLLRAISYGRPPADYDFSYAIDAPKQDISHDLWSVRSYYVMPRIGRFELQYGWQSNHRQEYDAHKRSRGLPNFDLTLTTYSLDVKLKHEPVGDVFGTVGVSGMRQGNVDVGLSFLIPNFRSYKGGAYVLENWSAGALTLNAGARYDHQWTKVYPNAVRGIAETVHEHGKLSGALGAIYEFAPQWTLGMNLGTAWRAPGVNELYSYGVHHGTAQFEIGDARLKTERSLGLDATVKYAGDVARGELSVYNNIMDDFIYLHPSPQPTLTLRGIFPTFIYRQADAVLRGFDASFEVQLTERYRMEGSVSVVRGENTSAREPLVQMPADRLRINNHYHIGTTGRVHDAYAEFGGSFVRRQDRVPAGVDYLEPPAGYAVFESAVGADLIVGGAVVRTNVSVKNLFNASYRDYLSRFRYFIDETGRSVILRIQIPIGDYH